jgi:hypothetical protein
MGLALPFMPLVAGAGAIFQGAASLAQGAAQAQAYKQEGIAQQQLADIQAQDIQIQAKQQEASRYEELARTVGNIDATVASRGLDPNSPSGAALQGAARTYAQRDAARIGFNAMQNSSNEILSGNTAMTVARARASLAQAAGYTSAMGSLFKATTYGVDYFNPKGQVGP